MKIEYDIAKSEKNWQERNLPFGEAAFFEWDTASVTKDKRRDYGEERFIAKGYLYGRLHTLCYALRPDAIRIISLRRSNAREVKAYEREISDR